MNRCVFGMLMTLIFFPLNSGAQMAPADPPLRGLPEEVIIIGDRNLTNLRLQMLEAERKAYDVFNAFNDEKRFHISCNKHQPTGSRLEQQVCQAAFELEASRTHARVYLDSLCDLLCLGRGDGQSHTVQVPQEIVIASQMEAYRRKMREIAAEHPEFLNALREYAQLRENYEVAARDGRQK